MKGMELKIKRGTEYLLTQETRSTGFFESFFKTAIDLENLTVDIVVADINPHCEGGNCHAFDHDMWI